MNEEKTDWHPTTDAGEHDLYGNIDEKIDAYKPKYPHLTTNQIEETHLMCQAFIAAYDTKQQNRVLR